MKTKEVLNIAISGLLIHKMRTFLTMLGIIFGVSAVIAMLAIGKGAEEEILDQIKKLGATTIKINAQNLNDVEKKNSNRVYNSGLSMSDRDYLINSCNFIKDISANIEINKNVKFKDQDIKSKLLAVDKNYFNFYGISNIFGRIFSNFDHDNLLNVCIISSSVKNRLFLNKNPINETLMVDGKLFKIIGYLDDNNNENKSFINSNSENIDDSNFTIFIPLDVLINKITSYNLNDFDPNYNVLKQIQLKIDKIENLQKAEDIIKKILKRRHKDIEDFTIEVPYTLLKRSQKTQRIFSIVMSLIAGISLLVGGIGIMNIMLASIKERTKEIGIRRAIGASSKNILMQFLYESIFISLIGGLIGIMLGVFGAYLVSLYTKWKIVYTLSSILIAFFISFSTGLFFGIYPSFEASKLDPIVALKYE